MGRRVNRIVRETLNLVLLGVACADASKTTAGTLKWAFTTGSYVVSSPTLSPDGATVYIGSFDYNVYALNSSTGDMVWSFGTGGWLCSQCWQGTCWSTSSKPRRRIRLLSGDLGLG